MGRETPGIMEEDYSTIMRLGKSLEGLFLYVRNVKFS